MPVSEGFLVPRNQLKTKKKTEREGKLENCSTMMELPSQQKLKDDTSGEYRFHLNHKLTSFHQMMNFKGSLASNGSLQIYPGFLLKYFLRLCFISVHPNASFSLVKKNPSSQVASHYIETTQ